MRGTALQRLGLAAVLAGLSGPVSGQVRFPEAFRTIDGRGNNEAHPEWGAAGTTLIRLTAPDYGDGLRVPAGASRLSARVISNLCARQEGSMPNRFGVSSVVWQWGQFLDHDLTLIEEADPEESMVIEVPRGDPFFDPDGSGTQTIDFHRSAFRAPDGVRQQVNSLTAFIDASQIYGSDPDRARALRTLDGTGRLRVSEDGLLPRNTAGLTNAPSSDPELFLAGDVRANEQVALTAMHTLFVREHNFWADTFRIANPGLDGDAIYQRARAIVAAEMQAITYREFIPALLGANALSFYGGYDASVDAGISNEFATAAFRFGHSMLPPELLCLDGDGNTLPAGNLSLADAFFAPSVFVETGMDPLLRGLVVQPSQTIDPHVVDAVRNFLFGGPRAGGFDLASLNVQRGRDHGLPSYNALRRALGLGPVRSFADINPDPVVQQNLEEAFADVERIDAWVGGLSEPPAGGGMVGETFRAILIDQFERSRAGDRFWYEAYLPSDLIAVVNEQTLSRIIARNTSLGPELPADVFRVSTR